jgi:hypothetical protein
MLNKSSQDAWNDETQDVYFEAEGVVPDYSGKTIYYEVDGIPVKEVYNADGTDLTVYSFLKGKWVANEYPTNFDNDGVLVTQQEFNQLVKNLDRKKK